jgi:hypothetical protein
MEESQKKQSGSLLRFLFVFSASDERILKKTKQSGFLFCFTSYARKDKKRQKKTKKDKKR